MQSVHVRILPCRLEKRNKFFKDFTRMGGRPRALAQGMNSPMPFRRHDIMGFRVQLTHH